MTSTSRSLLVAILAALISTSQAMAQNSPESRYCQTVHLADDGWLTNSAINAVAQEILTKLGYQTNVTHGLASSILTTMAATDDAQPRIDAYLNFWDGLSAPGVTVGSLPEKLFASATELSPYEIGFFVPRYLYQDNFRTLKDLKKFADVLNHNVLGLGRREPMNVVLETVLDDPELDLPALHVRRLNNAERVGAMTRFTGQRTPFVTYGIRPSSLVHRFDLVPLRGQAAWFNPNGFDQHIRAILRLEFTERCANAARLLTNLAFSAEQLGALLAGLDDAQLPDQLAAQLIADNPDWLREMTKGVTRRNGDKVDLVIFHEK